MNHKMTTLKLRGAALTACGGLITSALFAACSGDNAPVTTNDAGGDGSMTMNDSSMTPDRGGDTNPPTPDAPSDTSMARDASDSGNDSAGGGEAGDAGDGGGGRDGGEAGTIADGGDATMAEAEAAAPLPPLDLCAVLDTDWGLVNPDYSVRATAGGWGPGISGTADTNSFAFALTNDCALHGIQGFLPPDGGPNGVAPYLAQLNVFTLQFFGCGVPDAGALSFADLLPVGSQGHVFTVADLNELVKLYANAVNAEASFNWAGQFAINGVVPSPEPLTVDQINAIQAHLDALEAAMPGVNPSTTRLTLSNCASDAGGDSGGDAGTDAGGD